MCATGHADLRRMARARVACPAPRSTHPVLVERSSAEDAIVFQTFASMYVRTDMKQGSHHRRGFDKRENVMCPVYSRFYSVVPVFACLRQQWDLSFLCSVSPKQLLIPSADGRCSMQSTPVLQFRREQGCQASWAVLVATKSFPVHSVGLTSVPEYTHLKDVSIARIYT